MYISTNNENANSFVFNDSLTVTSIFYMWFYMNLYKALLELASFQKMIENCQEPENRMEPASKVLETKKDKERPKNWIQKSPKKLKKSKIPKN